MPNTPSKCAHMACTCMAPAGKKYCSTYCEDAKKLTTLACHCGHAGCDDKVVGVGVGGHSQPAQT